MRSLRTLKLTVYYLEMEDIDHPQRFPDLRNDPQAQSQLLSVLDERARTR